MCSASSWSPLARDKWDYSGRYDREAVAPDIAHPLAAVAVKHLLESAWYRSGLKTRLAREEFKSAHGFRKFAKTQLSRAGLSWEDQEVMLGHRMAYYKPTLEHLEGEYLKAVPFLTVSEAEQAKSELAKEKEEHENERKDIQLELLLLKERERERDKKQKEDQAIKAEYGERIARLEEQMRGFGLGRAPPEAQTVPRSRPRAGTSES